MAIEHFIQGKKPQPVEEPQRIRRDPREAAAPTFATSHDEEPNVVPEPYGPADGPEVPPWAAQGDPYLAGIPAPEQPDGTRQPWLDSLG